MLEPSPRAPSGPLTADEFAAHFRESFRTLWLVAVGVVRDSALAEDIVQDAAIVALGKLAQYQPGTSFRAWMGQTVRFVALNRLRKESKRRRKTTLSPELEHIAEERADGGTTPMTAADGRISGDQMHFDDEMMRALNQVGETARACLLLRTIEELEYTEISEVLGIPEGTAMSHVHRTRQFLRERLAHRAAGFVERPAS
ncbi:MAG: ECF RNA polymerase sigma factor SigR [Phycisphaerae bacterium]|nr:ECF RNA polymerase sigma factor SigR [Phycisphaerae bacterium]